MATLKKSEKSSLDATITHTTLMLVITCLVQVYCIDNGLYGRHLLKICVKEPNYSYLL
jgi:hypothetical protein